MLRCKIGGFPKKHPAVLSATQTNPMNTPSLRLIALPVLSALAAVVLHAQASATAADAGTVTKLETLVVTGSNLPTAADTADVPVVVLGQQDIAQTGLNSNLLEILRKRVPAFAGRSNAGNSNATNTNQNTAGGSQIALRNLDTLILINGRRLATSGINGAGGKSFVDINQIPAAAIDRMEVLTDGASAIYGSDAVGGVVNIILKSNYEGAELGGRYAFTGNNGHYSERSGYVVAGASNNGVNLTVSGSWSKTDPLWQYQRPFIANNLKAGTTFPGFAAGNYLAPGLNSPSAKVPVGTAATATSYADLVANGTYLAAGNAAIPGFRVDPYESILLQQEQRGALVDMSAELAGRKLVAFGDFLYAKTKSTNQTAGFLGNVTTVTVPAGAPYNPLTVAATGVVVGSVENPVITRNQSTAQRGTLGLRGEINPRWNWEVSGTYSDVKTNQELANTLFKPNVAAAIAGGYDASGNAVAGGKYSKVFALAGYPTTQTLVLQPALDPFARSGVDPLSRANVYGTELIRTRSKLSSWDAKLIGMPIDLPAGKLGLALGAEYRKETLSATPDQNSYNASTSPANNNWGGGFIFDPFSHSRTIDAYFVEVRAPVTSSTWNVAGVRALDVTLAGRSEKYSDSGSSRVPKLGLRWQPFDDQLTFRFSYSKSFTAPLLNDEYGPPNVGFASGNSFLYNFVLNGAGAKNPALIGTPYFSGNGNNPALQPSHAWSRSFGFALSPKALKGFTLNVNYVNVTQTGQAQGLGASTIVASVNTLGSASPYLSQIAVGGMPGTPGSTQAPLSAPGGLYNLLTGGSYANNLYILDHKVNTGGVRVEAIDINPAYEIRTADMGTVTLSTTGTYLKSFSYSALPGAPFYEYAGYSTNGQSMSGTMPKYSFYTTVDWKYRAWETTLGSTYMSSVTDIPSGKIPSVYLATSPAVSVSSYTTLDLQVAYTFSKPRLWEQLKSLRVVVGVNNLTNRMPPYAGLSQAASLNNNNADVAAYSPVGRLWFVSAAMKF